MDRPRLQALQLLVIFGAVELQGINAASALLGVKPAARDDGANRVDAVLNPMHSRNGDVLQPKAFQNFQAAFARSQLFSLGVVGDNMTSVKIRLAVDLSDIMPRSTPLAS
jgi:hypothetical protein